MNKTIDPAPHVWWLASRASGLVALALITLAVGIGLTTAGKLVRKRGMAPALAATHEQASLAALVATAAHGLTLLGDHFLHPGLGGIAIPFTMSYRPVFTGLGIIAGYLSAILGLSFYLRRRVGVRLWRKAHRFTVVAYVLALVHTFGAGTDAVTPWLRGFMLATALPIAALFVARVVPRRRGSAKPRALPANRPARSARPAISASQEAR